MKGFAASRDVLSGTGHLRVIHHGSELVRVDLPNREFFIGRKADNDIRIDSLAVSGRHARIRPLGDAILVEDLGSRNGTWVDGQRIQQYRLKPGEVFRIAHYRFLYGASPLERTLPWPFVPQSAPLRRGLVPQLRLESSEGQNNRTLPLVREITRLGKPGHTVIALIDQGWRVLLRHESGQPPRVNGSIPPTSLVPLRDRDRVIIDSLEFVFLYGPPPAR
jgi:hypothetical protein